MSGTTCTICLDDIKSPVSIPCGHLHCEDCLVQYVEQHEELAEAPCPTCRAPFCVATPDPRFVPQKYQKYLLPTVRRVYLSQAHPRGTQHLKDVISALENRAELLETQNATFRSRVATQEKRISSLTADRDRLMERCEGVIASMRHIQEKEHDARVEREKAWKELEGLKRKYADLKTKYKTLKHAQTPATPPTPPLPRPAKRTSAQAALGEGQNTTRLILPIPKRPRMAFAWRPTIGEANEEENVAAVKHESIESNLPQVKFEPVSEDDLDRMSNILSPPAIVNRYNIPSMKLKPQMVALRKWHGPPTVNRDMLETVEYEGESQIFAPGGRNRAAGGPPPEERRRAPKLKSSGLSMFLQKMDVDDADSSSIGSTPSPAVAGPSTRRAHRPARTGLGDVFSPSRSGGGHGSLDYSSPGRAPTTGADDEDGNDDSGVHWERDRTFVFRGRKVMQSSPAD